MNTARPQRLPRPEEEDAALDILAARVLAQRIACAQALRDGRRPTSGALNDTRADSAEQEDAHTN